MKKISAFKLQITWLILCIILVFISIFVIITNPDLRFFYIGVFSTSLLIGILLAFGITERYFICINNKTVIYKNIFFTKSINIEEIKEIKHVKKIFTNELRIKTNDSSKPFIVPLYFLTSNCINCDNFVAFLQNSQDLSLLEANTKVLNKNNDNAENSLIIISCIFLFFNVVAYIFYLLRKPMFPIVDIYFIGSSSFWSILIFALIILFAVKLKPNNFIYKQSIFIIMIIFFFPILILSTLGTKEKYFISHTDNISNYELIQQETTLPDYFPNEVTNLNDVISFDYFLNLYWDTICEVYLEVQYEEYEFYEIYDLYNKTSCWYNEEYEQYVIEEGLAFNDNYDLIEYSRIEKIIFNKQERIVIYVYLYVSDPYEIQNSHYFNRFNIDIEAYKDKVKNG